MMDALMFSCYILILIAWIKIALLENKLKNNITLLENKLKNITLLITMDILEDLLSNEIQNEDKGE